MARAVGLDIGTRAIKVVELSGTSKGFKILRSVVREIPALATVVEEGELPPDPEEQLGLQVRGIFDELKLTRDDVCVSFDAGTSVFREIQIPFSGDDQIRKVVKFEAENHLHNHRLEDVVVNYVKIGESRDGSRLTIFASPKEGLKRLLRILTFAGIEPATVDLDTTSLYTAYDAAGVFKEVPNAVVIDVGAHSTSLILVANGRPVTLRSFMLGADHVGARIGDELGLPAPEARERVLLPDGPRPDDLMVPASSFDPDVPEDEKSLQRIESEAVSDRRSEFVRKLHRESMRSLASLRSDAIPDRILLSGGGSLLPGLAESLHERFDLPVERVDLGDYVDWKDKGPDPELMVASVPAAVGCGLRLLGFDPFGIDLLQDEFAPTNRFDVLKTALATFVTLLFLVLLALAIVAVKRRDAESQRYRYATGRATSIYKAAEMRFLQDVENETEDAARTKVEQRLRAAPAAPERHRWIRTQLLQRWKWLRNELGMRRGIPPLQSGLKVWLEAVRALNQIDRDEYGQHFRILKMDIKPRSAEIRIEVSDQSVFDKVRRQFENSPYFRERARTSRVVEPGAIKSQDGLWQRSFDFRFKEEE